jgi:hypothetical protein
LSSDEIQRWEEMLWMSTYVFRNNNNLEWGGCKGLPRHPLSMHTPWVRFNNGQREQGRE